MSVIAAIAALAAIALAATVIHIRYSNKRLFIRTFAGNAKAAADAQVKLAHLRNGLESIIIYCHSSWFGSGAA